MSDPSIADVTEALANVIGQVPGLQAQSFVSDVVNAPEAQIFLRPFDPRYTFGDQTRRYTLGVRVFVPRTDPRSAQLTLWGFMEPSGSTSVRARIEDSGAWSVEVDYAEVTNVGQPFELVLEQGVFWCVDFDVDVVW